MFNPADIDLFASAISKLVPGQTVIISGWDQNGKEHAKEPAIVRKIFDNEFMTNTGLLFKGDQLTLLAITEVVYREEDLPFIGLTGQLETFSPESE